MTRFIACLAAASAAYFLARGVGIPIWRHWEPGDACDIALLVFVACWGLSK